MKLIDHYDNDVKQQAFMYFMHIYLIYIDVLVKNYKMPDTTNENKDKQDK